MSEQAPSGTSAEHDPEIRPQLEPLPLPHKYRVVSSAGLPSFSTHTPVVAGTIIWLVLLAMAIVWNDRLQAHDNGWWLWMAVSGIVLGLLGWLYLAIRKPDQSGRPEQSSHLDR